MTWPVRLAMAVIGTVLAGCATGGTSAPVTERAMAAQGVLAIAPQDGWAMAVREELHWVPVQDGGGQSQQLIARVCRPAAGAPAPVAVINHGSPSDGENRRAMQPAGCASEPAQWFLRRGYVVMFPLRRGYGASGGELAESSGACDSPDYVHAGVESARDVAAAVRYATGLPFVRRDGVVVVGQSLGGWATLAFAAVPHPPLAALISMAGGRGGHAVAGMEGNCRPDLLVAAAGAFGRTARTPMLWVYARNDSYFAPELARAMHRAFTAAGGQAALAQPTFGGGEGHGLFYASGGSRVWGPLVEAYLADRLRGG
jgi:pimeloyl-ACP methyl ester carboxylesterase